MQLSTDNSHLNISNVGNVLASFDGSDVDAFLALESIGSIPDLEIESAPSIPWIDNREPMPFDEFCIALDGCALYPRQIQPFVDRGLLRANAFMDPNRETRQLILLFGKGSGKDYMASKLIAYLGYLVLSLRGDPCAYYAPYINNLGPYSELTVLNVADNEDTAKRIFFGMLKRWIRNPIFDKFNPSVWSQSIVFFGEDPNGKAYIKLSLHSMTSTARGLEGYNIVGWVMDEADAFKDGDKVSNADILHDVLVTSANTRMRKMWLGVVITYTRYEEGFAMRMYAIAKQSIEGGSQMYYVDLAATWEVNPKFDRESDEVIDMYKHRPKEAAMMFECIDGDTWVVDSCGGLVQIKDAPSTIYKGDKRCIKITTKYGYEIICTPDHKLLLPDGTWSEAYWLSTGDSIGISQREQQFGSFDIDERISELVGQLVGDGYVSADATNGSTVGWVYDPKDADVADRQFGFLSDLGFSPYQGVSGRCIQVRLRTAEARLRFIELVGSPARAWGKKIPEWVYRSTKLVVAAFLRGLFEADGSINNRGLVSFGSTSLDLVKGVQLLLGLFGITSLINHHAARWNEKWGNQSKEFWTITLSQRRSIVFWGEIGFVSKRKQAKCHRYNEDQHRNFDSDLPIFPDKIASIEDVGICPVYDLLDRPDQRFFANGFIAHNCRPSTVSNNWFEFPELIFRSVDNSRMPAAIVTVGTVERVSKSSVYQMDTFEGILEITDYRKEAGRLYFLGCDAGAKKDSLVMAVVSTEDGGTAPDWFCPKCGMIPELTAHQNYVQVVSQEQASQYSEDGVICGMCGCSPRQFQPLPNGRMRYWWRRAGGASEKVVVPGGKGFWLVPTREELLIEVRPFFARSGSDLNRPVDFVSVQKYLIEMVERLGITSARFDPWQTISITQHLAASTGIDAQEISFSNVEQYRRATLVKTMLNMGLWRSLPDEGRDREWRRLQEPSRGKIDHPKQTAAGLPEGKDKYDAESIALWISQVYHCSALELEWT